MIDLSQVTDIMLGNETVTQIEDSLGNVLWSATPPAPTAEYFYVEDISGSPNTLSIVKEVSSIPTTEIFKSTDQTTWESMGNTDTTAITATVPANGKLYLKAVTSRLGNGTYNGTKISCTGNYNVGGYLTSLIFGDDFETNTLTGKSEQTFFSLFKNSVNLISAGKLIMPTTSQRRSYGNMFNGCTHLITAPSLSQTAVSWGCFSEMFVGCTSLTQAPVLTASTLAFDCYSSMFRGCTSLTSVITYADNISAADCLTNWLNNVSATGELYNLGSATYESGASGIPEGWTERTALPEYFYIENVSNDTATVSFNAGSDTTINIKVSTDKSNWVDLGLITNAPTYNLPAGDKLYISATGDTWDFAKIKCNKSFNMGGYIMSLLKGDNFSTNNHFNNEQTTQFGGIFGDNTTLISANNLILATNTDYHCYQWMFAGCTSLTTSPVLSAPRLVDICYDSMFYGCTSLNSVTTYAKDSTGGCNNWLYGVAAQGNFYNLGGATYESGVSGIPEGWTERTSL